MDKILQIKDNIVNRIKNISLVQGLEIGSSVALIFGAILIKLSSYDELTATDIVENYDPDHLDAVDENK